MCRDSLKRIVEKGINVQKLVEDLRRLKEVPYTIVVNGVVIESDYVLKESGSIDLLAPFSGG